MQAGSGRTLAIVPGGPGFSHDYLRSGLDPLIARRRLVYVDPPGSGRSSSLPIEAESPLESIVDGFEAVREALAIPAWSLFAHSNGGVFAALRYAARHPERLDGLILCCGAAAFDYGPELQAGLADRATPGQLAAFRDVLTLRSQDDESFRRRFLDLLPLYFARESAAAHAMVADRITIRAKPFDLFKVAVLPSYDARSGLSAIRQPTLVIAGNRDLIVPPTACKQLLAIPGATYLELAKSGHFPFVEEPEAFLAGIASWLDRIDRRGPSAAGLA